MSSTNKTTNYQLSQFVSDDKPAWLGDYNQDMAKIDAGMKENDDAITAQSQTIASHTNLISANTEGIQNLQGSIEEISEKADTADGKAEQAQTKANQANALAETADGKADTNTGNIAEQGLLITSLQNDVADHETQISSVDTKANATQTALEAFVNEFQLTKIDTITEVSGIATISGTSITLAQSPNSKIFKLYGRLSISKGGTGSYSYSRTLVKGLTGVYGIKSTLRLTTPPTETYVVDSAGVHYFFQPNGTGTGGDRSYIRGGNAQFAVDTDGYIWLDVSTSNTFTISSTYQDHTCYYASLYFNGNFGDIVNPEEQ